MTCRCRESDHCIIIVNKSFVELPGPANEHIQIEVDCKNVLSYKEDIVQYIQLSLNVVHSEKVKNVLMRIMTRNYSTIPTLKIPRKSTKVEWKQWGLSWLSEAQMFCGPILVYGFESFQQIWLDRVKKYFVLCNSLKLYSKWDWWIGWIK